MKTRYKFGIVMMVIWTIAIFVLWLCIGELLGCVLLWVFLLIYTICYVNSDWAVLMDGDKDEISKRMRDYDND